MSGAPKKVIIVGAGTAGAILAKRLAPHFDVTVFDKCLHEKMPIFYRVPLTIGLLFNRETIYVQKSSLPLGPKRKVPFFYSNLLGGASVINGCVHVMGSTAIWKKTLFRFGLALDDLRKSYQALFTKEKANGKISLTEAKKGRLDDAFFAALKERGIDRGDVEYTDAVASGMIFNTVKRYFRSSVLDISPFTKSKVVVGCLIERLVVDANSEIVGVFDGRQIILGD